MKLSMNPLPRTARTCGCFRRFQITPPLSVSTSGSFFLLSSPPVVIALVLGVGASKVSSSEEEVSVGVDAPDVPCGVVGAVSALESHVAPYVLGPEEGSMSLLDWDSALAFFAATMLGRVYFPMRVIGGGYKVQVKS